MIIIIHFSKVLITTLNNLGLKRGQNEVLGHFLGHYVLVFAGFAYYDSDLLYLVAVGD